MTTPTDPTPTDPHAPISFMAQLGQLEVKIEQAGVRLSNHLGEVIDHLSWDQVKHLLVPALRYHSPSVLAEPDATGTEAEAEAGTAAAGDVKQLPDELRDLVSTWVRGELDGLRAEVGKELDAVHARLDALTGDQVESSAVTTTEAAPAAAKKTAPRTARKTAAAAK